jgi:hypothetical protein
MVLVSRVVKGSHGGDPKPLRAHDFGASKNRAAANNPTPSKTSSLGIFRTPPPSDAPPTSLALLGSSRLFKIAHLDRHLRCQEREAPNGGWRPERQCKQSCARDAWENSARGPPGPPVRSRCCYPGLQLVLGCTPNGESEFRDGGRPEIVSRSQSNLAGNAAEEAYPANRGDQCES